jgi:hypothetical protein
LGSILASHFVCLLCKKQLQHPVAVFAQAHSVHLPKQCRSSSTVGIEKEYLGAFLPFWQAIYAQKTVHKLRFKQLAFCRHSLAGCVGRWLPNDLPMKAMRRKDVAMKCRSW